MQKISPFLWFDDQAEEAMNFYVASFENSKVGRITRYGDAGPGPTGSVMTASFELECQPFTALNGGPHFKFTEAVSLFVNCETQEEVDRFWDKLSESGQIQQCGWLKDKVGPRPSEVAASRGSHAADDQDRHRETAAGL
jgi:predicted 3-demethylubiquinone-9 3-methyltransferase (glyoxalase superfamily)